MTNSRIISTIPELRQAMEGLSGLKGWELMTAVQHIERGCMEINFDLSEIFGSASNPARVEFVTALVNYQRILADIRDRAAAHGLSGADISDLQVSQGAAAGRAGTVQKYINRTSDVRALLEALPVADYLPKVG